MTTTMNNPSSTPPFEAVAPNTVFERHPLQHQFEDLEQQHEVATLGMWVFLATEVLFFGALFVGLAAYRQVYPVSFEKASERLKWQIGALNTVVLLCSSFTMVLAVQAHPGDVTTLMVPPPPTPSTLAPAPGPMV